MKQIVFSWHCLALIVLVVCLTQVMAVAPNSPTQLLAQSVAPDTSAVSTESTAPYAPMRGFDPRQGINVRVFGAKGDCVTDDHDAIQRAMDYAYDHGSAPGLNSNGLPVYFPPAPRGCYLTSTLTWLGVPLAGDSGNGSQAISGHNPAVIRGKPGEDVFQAPEPTAFNARPPASSQSVTNLEILLDDSLDASGRFNPPRRPGRSVDDGIIMTGQNLLTSKKAEFAPGDVGQAIQVIGAGSDGCAPLRGSNCLNTYINAVIGRRGNSIIQASLAARATATLSANGTFYVSVAGLPVTQSIGNCAVAFPDSDGNTAHWQRNRVGRGISRESRWDQVAIRSVMHNDQGRNNTCALFFQGGMGPYHVNWSNFDLRGTYYGLIDTTSTINPTSMSVGQGLGNNNKFDTWEFNNTFPWITYNGEAETLDNFEIQASNGLQILSAYTGAGSPANSWYIDTPDVEPRGLGTSSGNFRVEGVGHLIVRSQLGPGTLASIQWDASASMCLLCRVNSSRLVLAGNCNILTIVNPGAHNTTVTDVTSTNTVMGVTGTNCAEPTWTSRHPRQCSSAVATDLLRLIDH